MGADVQVDPEYFVIKEPRLQGQRHILDYPSHTGTENVLMAACLAEGTTVIENASIEPEVLDLAGFLSAMGARIYGAGVHCTIGSDADTAARLTGMGAEHVECAVDEVVVDEARKLVTTPAYMLATSLAEAASGINKLVDRVLELA